MQPVRLNPIHGSAAAGLRKRSTFRQRYVSQGCFSSGRPPVPAVQLEPSWCPHCCSAIVCSGSVSPLRQTRKRSPTAAAVLCRSTTAVPGQLTVAWPAGIRAGDRLVPASVRSRGRVERQQPLQGRRHSPAQSWKSSGGRARHGVQRIKSRVACFPRESRGLDTPPIRPSRSRQGLDEACRTFGGRQSAATSAGSSPGCSAHRRNAMGMARRLGVPLASESSGQRLASSVQQEESHSCFERDGIGSYALAEVRSIVA